MNGKIKSTTMLYKRLNFSISTVRQLKKSLNHSLRIPSKKTKVIQWDDSLAHKNIFIVNGKKVKVDQQGAINFVERLINPYLNIAGNKENRKEDIETKGKYKYKINKVIKDESGSPVADYLKSLVDQDEQIDMAQVRADFDRFDIQRKAQKLKSIETYAELHNKLLEEEKPLDARKSIIQEAFFKFPNHNQVDVSPEFYIDTITTFYSKYFPDYKVLLTVYHGDELEKKGEKKVGDHPHIFIECKNKKTGQYDLTEQQARLANSFIDKFETFKGNEKVPLIHQSYEESQLIGEVLQQIFYEHVNNKFKAENISVTAERLEKTEENLKQRNEIRKEANLPKEQRAYQLYNLRKQQVKEKEQQITKLQKQLQNGNVKLKKISDDYENTNKLLLLKNDEYKELNQKLDVAKEESIKLEKEKGDLTSKKSELIAQNKKLDKSFSEKKNGYSIALKQEKKNLNEIKAEIKQANHQYNEIAVKLSDKLDKITISITDMSIIRHDSHSSVSHKKKSISSFKNDVYDIYARLTPQARKEYKEELKSKLRNSGADENLAELGIIDNAKLFISDNFTNQEKVSLDSTEYKEIKERRKLLKPGS